MNESLKRRRFLSSGISSLTAVWASAHWPALLAAADHARHAAQSAIPPKFEFFTAEQAVEIDAIASRIFPTDETPGAHEAGVVYFIDRALTSFAKDAQKTYQEGLPELQARVNKRFPAVKKFSAASPEQQDEVLHSFDERGATPGLPFGAGRGTQGFFETLRQHTITGFLIDPDYGGNHDGAGWKVIGREREHVFQPPFGYYDKDYPGWQPAEKEVGKK
jgi:gluconate 2-dehydrogenase gamma chain